MALQIYNVTNIVTYEVNLYPNFIIHDNISLHQNVRMHIVPNLVSIIEIQHFMSKLGFVVLVKLVHMKCH